MNDDKYDRFVVLVMGTFLIFIIIVICQTIIKTATIEKAMENGYVECIIDRQILWKKSCTER